jgi:tetratricopeptide (TPR) repeat protein
VGKLKICLALFILLAAWPCGADSGSGYILLGNEAAAMKDYDQALYYYNQAINFPGLDPGNRAIAYHNRGCVYYDTEQTDKALRDFTQSIALDPKYDPPYYHRSFIYEQQGDYERAAADMRKAISLDPSFAEYHERLEWLDAQRPQ